MQAAKDQRAWRRAALRRVAQVGGALCAMLKGVAPAGDPPPLASGLPHGLSVVIPSRNGRHLLASLLPDAAAQLKEMPSEMIVVDNGSDDGSASWLGHDYPDAVVDATSQPLSFADAVNRGAARARYSRLCLLNNDMRIHPGFFDALMRAFDNVPDLFCATAQIFMPEGQRREETGKPVYSLDTLGAVQVRCDEPVPGEDLSYVLYGSGGCSLYDTAKWRALGGMSQVFRPAYVEDLDIGFRAWRLAWPSVFVQDAKVLHHHRSTTSKYFDAAALEVMMETNYLRFLAQSVTTPALYSSMWRRAVTRVDDRALRGAWFPAMFMTPMPPAVWPEDAILALASGDVAVFQGAARRSKPVVLVVSAFLPLPPSHDGAVRIYNLTRRAAADFDQVLIAFVDELHRPAPELLNVFCELVCVRRKATEAMADNRPAFRAAVGQTVRKWKPAIAQLEFTQSAQYAPDCAPARTILVGHDIAVDPNRSSLDRDEKSAWTTVDRVVATSEKDRASIARPSAVALPNGVDIQRFRPTSRAPDAARILFIGDFRDPPNVLGLDWFLRRVWPTLVPLHPRLHVIAGERPDFYVSQYGKRLDLTASNIDVETFVADVRPALERATVVIAPLLASAGANMNVLEALATGKAVVSTKAGINGLDRLRPGYDVIVTDKPDDMAAAIAVLIADPAVRADFERNARQTAERCYDWDVIAREQRALYESLIG